MHSLPLKILKVFLSPNVIPVGSIFHGPAVSKITILNLIERRDVFGLIGHRFCPFHWIGTLQLFSALEFLNSVLFMYSSSATKKKKKKNRNNNYEIINKIIKIYNFPLKLHKISIFSLQIRKITEIRTLLLFRQNFEFLKSFGKIYEHFTLINFWNFLWKYIFVWIFLKQL